jgi:hypothetical protein
VWVVVAATLSLTAWSQATSPVYSQIATITVPGGLAGFDISWVDPGSQRYYLTDRTATKGTGRIDVVDTQANKFLYTIPSTHAEIGFAGTVPAVTPGCTISGPNGVVAIPQTNQLWVSDGDSTMKVIDLDAKAVVAVISTGGKCRADELAYDPLDHILMVANPNDNPPYLTFISTDTQAVLGKYTYPASQAIVPGTPGGGLEQPVYNAKSKKFYQAVPSTSSSVGSIDVFDPVTMKKVASYPTSACSPAGLTLASSQFMITSCGAVLDASTGTVVATVTGVSADQVWYNPGDNLYYFGGMGIVDANTNQNIATFPSAVGHTLAADPNNNRVFAPVSGVGIKVFAQQ